jgi:uncharacterized protein (TIGR02145 family)
MALSFFQRTTLNNPFGKSGLTHKNNKSGFSAVASGGRSFLGTFGQMDSYSYWWTATNLNENQGWFRKLSYDGYDLYNFYESKVEGYSVRCVKDK